MGTEAAGFIKPKYKPEHVTINRDGSGQAHNTRFKLTHSADGQVTVTTLRPKHTVTINQPTQTLEWCAARALEHIRRQKLAAKLEKQAAQQNWNVTILLKETPQGDRQTAGWQAESPCGAKATGAHQVDALARLHRKLNPTANHL